MRTLKKEKVKNLIACLSLAASLTCVSACPPEEPPPFSPGSDPGGSPDPAFLYRDVVASAPNSKKLVNKQDAATSGSADQASWQSISTEMEKTPSKAFQMVTQIWSENHSEELKKMAIIKAKGLVKSTDQVADLDFMLSCQENPEGQREACLALGGGNGLMRDLGEKQLATLEANPNLRSLNH